MPTLVKLPNVFQVNGSIPSLPSGTATVRNADTDALVSIYNDRAGLSLLSSAGVTTATHGQVAGWSAPGVTWKITITQQQGSQTATYGPYYHEANFGPVSADVSVFNTRLGSVESGIASVTAARALSPGSPSLVYLNEAGREGYFKVDASDATSADNGGTILVAANGARLKRIITGSYYRPEWFGAKGDWVDDATTATIGTGTDDTAAFQACADAVLAADASGMELRSAYLLTGTVYITPSPDSNRAKPFAIKGITGNPMTYRGRGARIVRRTSGDCFRVNLDSSGNTVLAAANQYFGFSMENLSFVGKSATATPTTTVTGIVGVRAFRTRMTTRNIAGVRVDDVVYQPDADASANANYCDQGTYDNTRIISSTRGGLRLAVNDGGRIAGFYYEGPFSTAVNGIELSLGTAIEVKNIVSYTDPAGAPDTGSAYSPAANSSLIHVNHANAVRITGIHSERQLAFTCLIDNNGSAATKVSGITTLYAGNTFIRHRAASRYLRIEDWICTEDRQASTYDVDISGSSTDLTWDRCYLTNYTGGAVRAMSLNGSAAVTDDSADGRFSMPYKVYGDANQAITHDGAYQLNPITAARSVTISAPVRPGQQVVMVNRNRTSFVWSMLGTQPLRPDGVLLTTLQNMAVTTLVSDANLAWRVVSVSTIGTDNQTVGKTAAYTVTDADHTIRCDATSGAFTVTLPDATVRPGREFLIKKLDASANAVTVGTTSSQTIDGSTTVSLATQNKYLRVEATTTGWMNVGSN